MLAPKNKTRRSHASFEASSPSRRMRWRDELVEVGTCATELLFLLSTRTRPRFSSRGASSRLARVRTFAFCSTPTCSSLQVMLNANTCPSWPPALSRQNSRAASATSVRQAPRKCPGHCYTDRLGGESSRQWHRGHVATCGRAVRAARSSGMQIIDGRRRSPIHHPTSTTSVLTLSLIWSASACVSLSQPSDTCSCMRWHLDSRPTTLAQPA